MIVCEQPASVGVYPRLELAALGKMKSVEKGAVIKANRRRPLPGTDRFLELPKINRDPIWIEPQLASRREEDIASESVADRVDSLIQRVPCQRGRAFRPEVGLDPLARETLPGAQSEHCQQA